MIKNKNNKNGKVYFVGAGPGATDLITIRGKRIIDIADCIIYAGSLVNKDLFTGSSAIIHDSSKLDLEQIIQLITTVTAQGGIVARVHTGDPALFGATKEQMVRLDAQNITYEVIPGVTSAFGAASVMNVELTLPEVSQSLIITRRGGRTPVPEAENLARLADHGSTMMIFLSIGMISEVVEDLLEGQYTVQTPVAVVQRATWPDEKIITGTLADISAKVKKAQITKTAIICVGSVFGQDPLRAESKLYDKQFSHGTRQAREL